MPQSVRLTVVACTLTSISPASSGLWHLARNPQDVRRAIVRANRGFHRSPVSCRPAAASLPDILPERPSRPIDNPSAALYKPPASRVGGFAPGPRTHRGLAVSLAGSSALSVNHMATAKVWGRLSSRCGWRGESVAPIGPALGQRGLNIMEFCRV